MHPSDRVTLAAKVGEAVTEAYIDASVGAESPDPILDCIADAVMEIIEPIAAERDAALSKVSALQEAVRDQSNLIEEIISYAPGNCSGMDDDGHESNCHECPACRREDIETRPAVAEALAKEVKP